MLLLVNKYPLLLIWLLHLKVNVSLLTCCQDLTLRSWQDGGELVMGIWGDTRNSSSEKQLTTQCTASHVSPQGLLC